MSVMLSAHVQTEVEEEDVGIHPQHPVVFGAGKLRELTEESQPWLVRENPPSHSRDGRGKRRDRGKHRPDRTLDRKPGTLLSG